MFSCSQASPLPVLGRHVDLVGPPAHGKMLLDGGEQFRNAVARQGRDEDRPPLLAGPVRGRGEPLALVRGEQVRLVPDLDDAFRIVRIDAELAQHGGDVARLGLRFAVRDVPDMKKDLRLDHVLQGGSKGRHEHGRQIRDEADGI